VKPLEPAVTSTAKQPVAKSTTPPPVGHHYKPAPPASGIIMAVIGAVLALAFVGVRLLHTDQPASFETYRLLQHFTVFVMAVFVGFQVVWNVTPALHTPLMSVTNAISGIIVVGGLLSARGELHDSVGGRRRGDAVRDHQRRRWLPGHAPDARDVQEVAMKEFAFTDSIALINTAYVVAAILFILALRGLSSQETARRGNLYGIIGMIVAVAATLTRPSIEAGAFNWLSFVAIAGGAVVGATMAIKVGMTSMPEMVALLHSFVGLAAVLVGFSLAVARPACGRGADRDLCRRDDRRDHHHRLGARVPEATWLGLG